MSSVNLMPVSTFSARLLTADSWTQTEMTLGRRGRAPAGPRARPVATAGPRVWPSIATADGCVKNSSDEGNGPPWSSGFAPWFGNAGWRPGPTGGSAWALTCGEGGSACCPAMASASAFCLPARCEAIFSTMRRPLMETMSLIEVQVPGAGHGGKNVNAGGIDPIPPPGGESCLACRINANRPVAADIIAAVHCVQHGVEGGELRGRVRIRPSNARGLTHRAARAMNDRAQNHIVDRCHVVHRPADAQIDHLFADTSA